MPAAAAGAGGAGGVLSRLRLGRRSNQRRRTREAEILIGADINRAEVLHRVLVRADDARRNQHHDVGLADLLIVFENNCRRTGTDITPGNPLNERRSWSCSSPASRCDSPSRSRSLVVTERVGNDGARRCRRTIRDGPSVSFDMTRSSRMSPWSVTRGVAWTLMPTVRNVYDDNGFTFALPRAEGRERRRHVRFVRSDLERQLRAFRATQLRIGQKLRVGIGVRENRRSPAARSDRNRRC